MIIDLRSDTIARPTREMLDAMFAAEVGDDVFDEDPTVKKLEKKLADQFGMEQGLFCPSGTMTNQIAIRILTQPQDELICDEKSHIYHYEGGGIAYNSMVSTQLVKGAQGRLTVDLIKDNVKPDDIYFPRTRLVVIENTINKGGGSIYKLKQIRPIYEFCRDNHLRMHLDGARLFNALVETRDDPKIYGEYFDTISICLSKGLGAPVGSVLLGTASLMKQAKRVRKVLGGGMRQSGYLAAAGIYALDHHVEKLKDDHRRAKRISETLKQRPWVTAVNVPESNIVIFSLNERINPHAFLQLLESRGVLAVSFGGQQIRFVTHLEFDDIKLQRLGEVLTGLNPQFN